MTHHSADPGLWEEHGHELLGEVSHRSLVGSPALEGMNTYGTFCMRRGLVQGEQRSREKRCRGCHG